MATLWEEVCVWAYGGCLQVWESGIHTGCLLESKSLDEQAVVSRGALLFKETIHVPLGSTVHLDSNSQAAL